MYLIYLNHPLTGNLLFHHCAHHKFREGLALRVGHGDGHVAEVDLELLDGSLRAELSDGAQIFSYVDNNAVIAQLSGEGLPHVSHWGGQLHRGLLGRTESPSHVAQRAREAGWERRNRQAGRGLGTVLELATG